MIGTEKEETKKVGTEKVEKKKERNNSYKNILYMLGLVHHGYPGKITFGIIVNIMNRICDVLLFVYFVQYIFESVEYHGTFRSVFLRLTILVLCEILIKVLVEVHKYYTRVTDPAVYQYIYEKVVARSNGMPLHNFENPLYFDKYQRALDEAKTNASLILKHISDMFGSILAIVVLVLIIIRNDPVVLIFAITPIFIVAFVNVIFSNLLHQRKNALIQSQRKAEYCKRIFYEKKYANEVRLFPIKKLFLELHEKAYQSIRNIYLDYNKKIIGIEIFYKFFLHLSILGVSSIYITYQITEYRRLSAGAFASLLVASFNIAQTVAAFMSTVTELMNQGKNAQDLIRFLEEDTLGQVKSGKELQEKSAEKIRKDENSGLEMPGKKKQDEFQNLNIIKMSFGYLGAKQMALQDINLTIRKGEKIAFVGYNGAGKTTLVKLILGLYQPTKGAIHYNSKNVEELEEHSYQSHFSVVFQDYQLYSLPLSTNILMKDLETEEEKKSIEHALLLVGLKEKIDCLEQGIKTCLTHEFDSSGLLLSGGESQKIAIARAFANTKAEIVILDEPSSALDPISEFNIYENIMKEFKDKTVIFISHRLSTARMADRICMFEKGRIIEEGSHDELMALDGAYSKMFLVQAKKYTDEATQEFVLNTEGGEC